MKKRYLILPILTLAFILVFTLLPVSFISADPGWVYKTTNELNKAKQTPGHIGQLTPYVNLVDTAVGAVTLDFVGSYTGGHYFEYRIDGEVLTSGTPHVFLNTIHGDTSEYEYPGVWVVANTIQQRILSACKTVEVRLALGAENDWYFDWVSFDVLPGACKGSSEEEEEEAAEPAIWERNHEFQCWQVWVNEQNQFEFVFVWEYANNNHVQILDKEGNIVFYTDLPKGDCHFTADLPDGTYTVQNYHEAGHILREFTISKP